MGMVKHNRWSLTRTLRVDKKIVAWRLLLIRTTRIVVMIGEQSLNSYHPFLFFTLNEKLSIMGVIRRIRIELLTLRKLSADDL